MWRNRTRVFIDAKRCRNTASVRFLSMTFHSSMATDRPPMKPTPMKATPTKLTPPRQTPVKPMRT
jgi:hypothetical protein